MAPQRSAERIDSRRRRASSSLVDPELEDDPVKPLADEMDDEIPFRMTEQEAEQPTCRPAAQQPRSRGRVRSNGRGTDREVTLS